MMTRPPTVAARAIAPLLARLEDLGVDVTELLARRGVKPEQLSEDEARIDLAQTEGLWEEAAVLSGDADFGLHLAERTNTASFGLYSYLAVTSASFGVALKRLSNYFTLLSDASGYELSEEGTVARVRLCPYPGLRLPRQVAEFSLAVLCCQARRLVREPVAFASVRFSHPRPSDVSEHERILGAPVSFGCETAELRFERRILNLPLRSADEKLAGILVPTARAELERALARPQSVGERVSTLLPDLIRRGFPSLDDMAHHLALSPRSLQRQLSAEGLSFRRMVGQAQSDVAAELLRRRELSVGEVAVLVGFSEVAAFHRAFKRATGLTPTQYRTGISS